MITYTDSLDGVTPDKLKGFFVGWPNPPTPETHLEILRRGYKIVLAIDDSDGSVVGFVNAISDGILSAYIPLLEVLPDYQGQGIGRELMRRLLHELEGLYMIDLTCDHKLQSFYEQLGMRPLLNMMRRDFDCQSGRAVDEDPDGADADV